jgi:arylsulfatase A-like enzyme
MRAPKRYRLAETDVGRFRAAIQAVVGLSPQTRLFFYATSLAHVLLKLLLGLSLAVADRYGFASLVAPPQGLLFAGADIVTCFVCAKLLDLCVPQRVQQTVQDGLFMVLFSFLLANFIVHTYFKAFVNLGLIAFNGASATEIIDYTIAGLTRYSITFACSMLAVFLCASLLRRRLLASRFLARPHLPVYSLGAGILAMAYVGTLGSGQCGFLSFNPGFSLLRSFALTNATLELSATAEQAAAFTAPQPILGQYDVSPVVALPSQRGKNVLFVLIESLPYERTPLGGARGGLTVLSELAENGVSFSNFHTVFPATSRSFLAYHCGIYPTTGNATVTKFQPGYACDSILDSLHARGYRTGFFTAPMFTYDNLDKSRVVKGYDTFEDLFSLRARAQHASFDAPAVEEEAVSRAALEFMEKDRTRPFFTTYFMFWNHSPYRLPASDISALPPLERYQRTLEYLDQVLRDLLARLEADGILEHTLVIVSADHGEGFAIHHDNKNHVGHIYEDDVHIPLVFHVPGLGKHETHRLGSNVDFAPTLAALLGLPCKGSWQGQDLFGADFKPRPLLLFGRSSFTTNGLLDGQYKYIEYVPNQQRALYDLALDPHEQENLAGRYPERVRAYAGLVHSWLPVAEYRALAVEH